MPGITLRRGLMSLFRAVWLDMSSFPFHGVSPASQQELLVTQCALPFCVIDFRLPSSALVTASDASESGCGVCRSRQLTVEGRTALAEFDRPLVSHPLRTGLVAFFFCWHQRPAPLVGTNWHFSRRFRRVRAFRLCASCVVAPVARFQHGSVRSGHVNFNGSGF